MLHIKIDRRRPSSIFLTQPVLSKNEKQLSVSSDIGHLMLCNYSLYTVLKQEMPNKCKKRIVHRFFFNVAHLFEGKQKRTSPKQSVEFIISLYLYYHYTIYRTQKVTE